MIRARWAAMGESTFEAGIWFLYWTHRLLGRRSFRLFLAPVVAAHWIARPAVRAASLEYLARVEAATGAIGRAPGWRDGLRHVQIFAETVLDKLLAVSGRFRFDEVLTEGRDRFYEAARRGRGGVIVTAHMGCLELCRAMAERAGGVRLNILVHTRHAQRFNRILQRLGGASSVRLLEVTELGPETAAALVERVDAGEFVVIAGDRVPVGSDRTVSVPFLGREARLPVGPYVLAALMKCPLHLLLCFRDGARYVVRFETLAERVELPRPRSIALASYALAYVARLEAALGRAPFDWFNFYPFWDPSDASEPSSA